MKDYTTMKKKIIYSFVALLIFVMFFLFLFEIAAYHIMVTKWYNFYLPLDLNNINKKAIIEKFTKIYDNKLGWDDKYESGEGYRGEKVSHEDTFIAVFGPSYAVGFPEDINISWPEMLEKKLNKTVLNYGIGGYGTDQALWKYRENYDNTRKLPIAVLVITPGNIALCMNRYRGFFLRSKDIEVTKPMYYINENDEIVYLENPLKSPGDLPKLADMTFLKEIGQQDYWFQYYDKYNVNKKAHFPYSFFLVRAFPLYAQQYYKRKFKNEYPYKHLYKADKALRILEYIVDEFIKSANENNTLPIISFLPEWFDLQDYLFTNETIYNDFYEKIKRKHEYTFDGLRYFIPYIKGEYQIKDLFRSYRSPHYNELGEEIVAEGFYQDVMSIKK